MGRISHSGAGFLYSQSAEHDWHYGSVQNEPSVAVKLFILFYFFVSTIYYTVQWSYLSFVACLMLTNCLYYVIRSSSCTTGSSINAWFFDHCLNSPAIICFLLPFLDASITGTDLNILSSTATDLEKWSSWFHFRYFVCHACLHHLSITFGSSIIPGHQKLINYHFISSIDGPQIFICHNNQGHCVLCPSFVANPILKEWLANQGSHLLCSHVVSSPTHWNFCLP